MALFRKYFIILDKNATISTIIKRCYAKKSGSAPALSEAQMQAQKHATELQYKPKTSLKGKPYNFQDLTTSLRYMESEAYKAAYGDNPVWLNYIRNFGGHKKPSYTRQGCIRKGVYGTGNPCPICRDEFLILHYKNMKLLKQFISESSGQLLPVTTTNICNLQDINLKVAYEKAKDHGLLDHPIPFRKYDYSLYYEEYSQRVTTPSILLNIVTAAKAKNVNKVLTDLTDEDVMNANKI